MDSGNAQVEFVRRNRSVLLLADPPAGDKAAKELDRLGAVVEYHRNIHTGDRMVAAIRPGFGWVVVMNSRHASEPLRAAARRCGARLVSVPPGWSQALKVLEAAGLVAALSDNPLAKVEEHLKGASVLAPVTPVPPLAPEPPPVAAPQAQPAAAGDAQGSLPLSGQPPDPADAPAGQQDAPAAAPKPPPTPEALARAARCVETKRLRRPGRLAVLAAMVDSILAEQPGLTVSQVGEAVRARGGAIGHLPLRDMVDAWRTRHAAALALQGRPADPPPVEVTTTADGIDLPAEVADAEARLVAALRRHPQVSTYSLTVVGGAAEHDFEVEVRKVAKVKGTL